MLSASVTITSTRFLIFGEKYPSSGKGATASKLEIVVLVASPGGSSIPSESWTAAVSSAAGFESHGRSSG